MKNSPISVTWVVFSYPSGGRPEGVFFQNQVEALIRAGVNVDVVAPTPDMSIPGLRSYGKRRWRVPEDMRRYERVGSVGIWRPRYLAYPGHIRAGWPNVAQYWAIRRLDLEPSPVVHAHYAYPYGHAGLLLARSWGVPLVLTLHGGDVNAYPKSGNIARQRFVRVVRGADLVLAVSDSLAERTYRIAGVRPLVLPVGIRQVGSPQVQTGSTCEQLGVPLDRFVVLFVGHLLRSKGVHLLLEALAQIGSTGVHGIFIGTGDLAPLVRRSRFATLLGELPNRDVRAVMECCDVLVLPSESEGLSTVVCEAGASRLPVIGSSVGGVVELLREGRGFILSGLDASSLAREIDRVRRDRGEAHLRAKRLRAHVARHYDVDRNAHRLRALYEKLRGGFRVDRP